MGREKLRNLNIISTSFMHGFMSFKTNKQKVFMRTANLRRILHTCIQNSQGVCKTLAF